MRLRQQLHKIQALYTSPLGLDTGVWGPLVTLPYFEWQKTGLSPITPLFCTLVMDHLAIALRANPDITGIQLGPNVTKLSLFTDDLHLCVTIPLISIPSIINEFKRFSHLSNFKVNYSKSKVLNISLPPLLQTVRQTVGSFHENHRLVSLRIH